MSGGDYVSLGFFERDDLAAVGAPDLLGVFLRDLVVADTQQPLRYKVGFTKNGVD